MGSIAVYHSCEEKSKNVAHFYTKTHDSPHRYLAYKDIPPMINQFVKGKKALDYGSGTGASSSFLHSIGLDVTGADISQEMLDKARISLPQIKFYKPQDLKLVSHFDLVFSSFVLFELSNKSEITNFLCKVSSFLNEDGIFIGITGSEQMYSLFRNWYVFDAKFEENRNLKSGSLARILLKHPQIEFYDYYWKEKDYLDCFAKSELEVLKILHPTGLSSDPYQWEDELFCSPFTIFIAQKRKNCTFI